MGFTSGKRKFFIKSWISGFLFFSLRPMYIRAKGSWSKWILLARATFSAKESSKNPKILSHLDVFNAFRLHSSVSGKLSINVFRLCKKGAK